MAAEDELYLENLAEYVLEEDKIVTYKWLSRTLSVNVNVAKQMLFAFVEQQRNNNGKTAEDLNVMYIVGGRTTDQNDRTVLRYTLVSEDNLQEKKKEFHPLTCVHVYSVHKSKPKSSSVLYLADYELQKENLHDYNKYGTIHCKQAQSRRIRGTQAQSNGHVSSESNPKLTNGNHETKPQNRVKDEEKPKVQAKPQKPKHGQQTAMDMFKSKPTTSKKTAVADSTKTDVKSEEPKKKKETIKESGMRPLFSKQASSASSKPKSTEKSHKEDEEKAKTSDKEIKKTTEEKKKSSDTSPPSKKAKKDDKTDKKAKKQEEKVSSSTDKNSKASRKQEQVNHSDDEEISKKSRKKKIKKPVLEESDSEEEKPVKKKRKRTKELAKEDSSEEDIQVTSSPNEESPIPKRLQESVKDSASNSASDSASIPSHQPTGPRRKRKRVLKSKMYMNDEGFMVTEKVWESDSTDASDEEEQKPAKTQLPTPSVTTKPKPEVKKPTTGKAKQASLTSFFKRS